MVIVISGIPEYNCFINASKTIKNFEVTESEEAELNADGIYIILLIAFMLPCVAINYALYHNIDCRPAMVTMVWLPCQHCYTGDTC